jgi:hypothetical protein
MDDDGDDKQQIHKWNDSGEGYETLNNKYSRQESPTLTQSEIEEIKIKQTKRNKSKRLTREIVLNLIFLYVLFVACYSNRDENSFSYNNHLKSIFQEFDSVFIFSIPKIRFFFDFII